MLKKTEKGEKPTLAKNIIRMRKSRGWKSAEKFAEDAGIPYGTIRDIEAGYSEGQPETKRLIAKALGCTVEELYIDPSKIETKPADPTASHDLTETYKEINSIIGRLGPDDIRLALRALRDIARTPDKITPPTIDEDEATRPVRRR